MRRFIDSKLPLWAWAILLLSLHGSAPGQGGDGDWNGDGDNDAWSNPDNWNGSWDTDLPGPEDSVQIWGFTGNIDLAEDVVIGRLDIADSIGLLGKELDLVINFQGFNFRLNGDELGLNDNIFFTGKDRNARLVLVGPGNLRFNRLAVESRQPSVEALLTLDRMMLTNPTTVKVKGVGAHLELDRSVACLCLLRSKRARCFRAEEFHRSPDACVAAGLCWLPVN